MGCNPDDSCSQTFGPLRGQTQQVPPHPGRCPAWFPWVGMDPNKNTLPSLPVGAAWHYGEGQAGKRLVLMAALLWDSQVSYFTSMSLNFPL